jgi:hypothetical protein
VTRIDGGVTIRQESPTGGIIGMDLDSEDERDWFADWDSTDRLWIYRKNDVLLLCTDDGRLGVRPPKRGDWANCPESFAELRHR